MNSKNIKYLVFTLVLLILSGLGVFGIFKINSSPLSLFLASQEIAVPTAIPTQTVPTLEPSVTVVPTITSVATSAAKTTVTPTPKTTTAPTAKVTPVLTSPESLGLLTFKSTTDAFSVDYSSTRKLYQDTESTGNRYTFYNSAGNIAIHVSPSGTWSWTNPDRNFDSSHLVAGQNSFRYDIATQTIVDIQSQTKNYTIQCIHNGQQDLKTECEAFIKSLTLF